MSPERMNSVTLGSLITATLLGIGDYVSLHVVFSRTKLSVFLSIIPPQLLGFYKVANTVLLSISEPRANGLGKIDSSPRNRPGVSAVLGTGGAFGARSSEFRRSMFPVHTNCTERLCADASSGVGYNDHSERISPSSHVSIREGSPVGQKK